MSTSLTPIRLHSDNPHYFSFRGKPTILITSAEHYGAVINLDFDYIKYLDTLAAYDLNSTRIYPGALIEREGDYIEGNTLAPRSGRLILPWARSSTPGFALGGNKFDLDTWDEDYFTRLRDFLEQASQRDIVVEICFFNCQYPHNWSIQALHHTNNIQATGQGDHTEFQTLHDAELVRRQEAFVTRIIEEVNPYDNVILEICDEPGISGTPVDEYHQWISHLIDVALEAEASLPNRHLVAQQVEGELGGAGDFSADDRVSIIVGQYVWYEGGKQIGGLKLLETDYEHEKPIELNETAYYPVWYTEDREAASRVEAWEFIIGGGASYNHLNGIFTALNPSGEDPNNRKVLSALKNLRQFIASFDFIHMKRDTTTIVRVSGADTHYQCLSEVGRQYAFYLHHSFHRVNRYIVQPGLHQDTVEMNLPPGVYFVQWLIPEWFGIVAQERFIHVGGHIVLRTPPFRIDIALKIIAD